MKRYVVKVLGKLDERFENLKEARHYARKMGGIVWDNVEKTIVYDYRDDDCWYECKEYYRLYY